MPWHTILSFSWLVRQRTKISVFGEYKWILVRVELVSAVVTQTHSKYLESLLGFALGAALTRLSAAGCGISFYK